MSLFILSEATAQYDQSSYSIIGLGNVNWGGYSHNAAMGGLGVTYTSNFFLNNINPALTVANSSAVFQTGGSLDIRQYTQADNQYNSVTGGFKDFGFSLPIVFNKWNLSISLNPYTAVNYGFTDRNEGAGPDGSTPVVEVEGRGGLDEISITNGFKIKNLMLGFKASIIFGSIQKEDRFFLEGIRDTGFGNSVVNTTKSFHNLSFGVGALYKLPVGENKWLNIGGFYNPELNVRQNNLTTLENQSQGGTVFDRDTLINDEAEKKTITIPQRFGFGVSYEKYRKLTIGADFLAQDWAGFRDEDGDAVPAYGNSYRFALGGQFTPNIQSNKLLSLISYRFGFHFEQSPYFVNNESINDIGINFGLSVPLNAIWGTGYLNLGATLGQRGNVSNDLVRENYVKIHIGFSLQDITWFTRQRFN